MYRYALILDDDLACAAFAEKALLGLGIGDVNRVTNMSGALASLQRLPDLLLTEVVVAQQSCIPALERIRQLGASPTIIAFSARATRSQVFRLQSLGVSTFLEKPFSAHTLRQAVQGGVPTLTRVSSRGADLDERLEAYRALYRLTNAEIDVLRHSLLGMSREEIAVERGVSVNTLKTHVKSILSKTSCPSMKVLARQHQRAIEVAPFAQSFEGGR